MRSWWLDDTTDKGESDGEDAEGNQGTATSEKSATTYCETLIQWINHIHNIA